MFQWLLQPLDAPISRLKYASHGWDRRDRQPTSLLFSGLGHHQIAAVANSDSTMSSGIMEFSRGTWDATAFNDRSWKSLGFRMKLQKNHTISVVLLDFLGPLESTWEIHGNPTRGESEFAFHIVTNPIWIFQHHPWHFVHPQQHGTPIPTVPLLPFWEGRRTDGRKLHRWQISGKTWSCGHNEVVFQMIQMLWISLDNFLSHVLILHLFQNGIPVSKTQLTFPNNSWISGWVSQREFVRLHWCFILMQVGQWILMTSVVSKGRGSAQQSWRNHPMYWRRETLSSVYTLHRILSQDFYFIYVYLLYTYTSCMYTTLAAFH